MQKRKMTCAEKLFIIIINIIYYNHYLSFSITDGSWKLEKNKIWERSKKILTWHLQISIFIDLIICYLSYNSWDVPYNLVSIFSSGALLLTVRDVCHQRTATKSNFTYLKRRKIHSYMYIMCRNYIIQAVKKTPVRILTDSFW